VLCSVPVPCEELRKLINRPRALIQSLAAEENSVVPAIAPETDQSTRFKRR
jgi:hypothetical protein